MTETGTTERIEKVKQIVSEASKIALGYFGRTTGMLKKDNSIVTQADIEVGKFLTEKLTGSFPGYGIINEECETNNHISDQSESRHIWVIDPIDGTSAFNARLPIWGISVGLLKYSRTDCTNCLRPVLGMIYLPVLDEYYYTDEGIPAYFESPRWGKLQMDLRNAVERPDNEMLICSTSDVHRTLNIDFGGKVRSLGSTSAHFCFVTRGDAVGAITAGYLWDIVMGMAILEKAGGRVVNLDGSTPDITSIEKKPGRYMLAASEQRLPELIKKISLKEIRQ
ncbi:MAG: inositol monophosphatase [Firmicutes bacterium]|nr:inositol monophosphatase [Bacillota bacterium]